MSFIRKTEKFLSPKKCRASSYDDDDFFCLTYDIGRSLRIACGIQLVQIWMDQIGISNIMFILIRSKILVISNRQLLKMKKVNMLIDFRYKLNWLHKHRINLHWAILTLHMSLIGRTDSCNFKRKPFISRSNEVTEESHDTNKSTST